MACLTCALYGNGSNPGFESVWRVRLDCGVEPPKIGATSISIFKPVVSFIIRGGCNCNDPPYKKSESEPKNKSVEKKTIRKKVASSCIFFSSKRSSCASVLSTTYYSLPTASLTYAPRLSDQVSLPPQNLPSLAHFAGDSKSPDWAAG